MKRANFAILYCLFILISSCGNGKKVTKETTPPNSAEERSTQKKDDNQKSSSNSTSSSGQKTSQKAPDTNTPLKKDDFDKMLPGSFHFSKTVSGITFQYGESSREYSDTLNASGDHLILYLKGKNLTEANKFNLTWSIRYQRFEDGKKTELYFIQNKSPLNQDTDTEQYILPQVRLDLDLINKNPSSNPKGKIKLTVSCTNEYGVTIQDENFFYFGF